VRDRILRHLISLNRLAGLFLALGIASSAEVAQVGPAGSDQPALRLPSGAPDLGGTGTWGLPYITDLSQPVDGEDPIDIPFQPWARAVFEARQASNSKYDPEGYCLPPGIPRALGTPYPMQFIQQDSRIIQIFEGGAHIWREIFMDGRAHPEGDALNPTYNGHSVGHWDGETLVVDVVGFNERTWLDTLRYEATINDPKTYTRGWTTAWTIAWQPEQELQEYICQENNRYLESLIREEVIMSLGEENN
jgi:hypothetical protein